MQLHQLADALAVAEEKSFTAAAARLHLAQPSLSRQVRLLEQELGVLLFNRGPGQGPVTLTPDGAALLPFMQRVLADVEATGAEARALSGMARGRLAVGRHPEPHHQRAGARARRVPRQPPRHRPGRGGGGLAPAGAPGGVGRGRPGPGRAAGDRPAGGDHAALRRPPRPRHRARPPLRPPAPGPRARPGRPRPRHVPGGLRPARRDAVGLPGRGGGAASRQRGGRDGRRPVLRGGRPRGGRGPRHRAAGRRVAGRHPLHRSDAEPHRRPGPAR